ncbi:hypothetical protein CKA32_004115 [Geitlerinema sp. FC II]|nr:hypothetical protein CKA32_004115 [Geitlerinema sp. FC II]
MIPQLRAIEEAIATHLEPDFAISIPSPIVSSAIERCFFNLIACCPERHPSSSRKQRIDKIFKI